MIDGFSEQDLCTLPSGGRQHVCGVPVDGISIEDGTDTSTDLVNLSNDSTSTRGKRSQTVQCCWTSSRAREVYERI